MQKIHTLYRLGQTELNGLHSLLLIVSWTLLTVSQSCSSGRFPRAHNADTTQTSPKHDGEDNIQPNSFKDRIICISVYNDIDWCRKGYEESCNATRQVLPKMPESSSKDIGLASYTQRNECVGPRSFNKQRRRKGNNEKSFQCCWDSNGYTAVDPVNEPQRDESYDVNQPLEVPYRTKLKVYPECSSLDQSEKCSRQRGWN